MKKIILSLFVVAALASCNSGGGWTADQKDKLRKPCVDGLGGAIEEKAAKKYCDCVVDEAVKKYSSYSEMEKKGSEEAGKELGMKCIGELMPGK